MDNRSGPDCKAKDCHREGGFKEGFCAACYAKCLEDRLASDKVTLRDQMAAAALPAVLSGMALEVGGQPATIKKRNQEYYELVATVCFHVADAMMAERGKRNEPEREQWLIDGHHPAIEDIQVAMGQGRKPRLEPDGTVTIQRDEGGKG